MPVICSFPCSVKFHLLLCLHQLGKCTYFIGWDCIAVVFVQNTDTRNKIVLLDILSCISACMNVLCFTACSFIPELKFMSLCLVFKKCNIIYKLQHTYNHMSDWEDDDFGGFESADIGDAGTVETAVISPSTLNVAPSPKEPAPGSVSQSEILDWILSNTSKTDAAPLPTSPQVPLVQDSSSHAQVTSSSKKPQETSADGVDPFDSPSSVSHGEQLKDRLNDSAEIAKNLDDIYANCSAATQAESGRTAANWSADFSETQKKIEAVASQEPVIERSADNESLHKLQAELDAALVMKEQSEKMLESLQEELKQLTEKRKKDLEECAEKHKKEVKTMKTQHKDEMTELQKTSEETVAQVTKQFSEIWKVLENEKSMEAESMANSIVEKCLGLMKQQQETLSQKLKDDRILQEKAVAETLERERENMQKNIENQLEKGRENMEKVLDQKLKEKLEEEAKKLQELHTATLKDAMEKQQSHFEEILQSTLSRERERFAETLKEAVRDAQSTTEKAAEERKMVEEKRTRHRSMSVKMFLTSALRQLEEDLPDGSEQSSQAKGDST